MMCNGTQDISQSKWTDRFIDNFRKLLFQIAADRQNVSADEEKRLGRIPVGAARIAGPLAFSTMGKILRRRTSVTMGELTKKLFIPASTTNRLVTWWVDNGLAERLQDSNDKRIIRVKITDAGIKFCEISQEIASARIESFFKNFTEEEIMIFNVLFDKLALNLKDLSDE